MRGEKYRSGIIGLGFIGGADQVSGDVLGQRVESLDGTHLDAMLHHPLVELVAGSSRDAGRRARFAERTSARTYADWREMLAREQLDIVSVATYAPQHAEMTVACAQRGVRAIYCEKPMATKLADADRMLAACQNSKSLLAINHNRRFQPNFRRLRDGIAAGVLGELTSAAVTWGTGRLGNVGTHFFNTAVMLVGRRVEAVSATLDLTGRPDCRGAAFHDPGGWGLLRFEGGLITTFDAADHGKLPATITINGTDRSRAIAEAGNITPAVLEREDRSIGNTSPPRIGIVDGPRHIRDCGLAGKGSRIPRCGRRIAAYAGSDCRLPRVSSTPCSMDDIAFGWFRS